MLLATAKSPVAAIVVMSREVARWLVDVTVEDALVVPMVRLAKVTLSRESVAATEPVPLRFTVCGLSDALSTIVSVPTRAPAAVGENVTPILQVAPATRLTARVTRDGEVSGGRNTRQCKCCFLFIRNGHELCRARVADRVLRKRKGCGGDGNVLREQTQACADHNKRCKEKAENPLGDRRRCKCTCDGDSGAHSTSEMMPELQFLPATFQEGRGFPRGEIPEGRLAGQENSYNETKFTTLVCDKATENVVWNLHVLIHEFAGANNCTLRWKVGRNHPTRSQR